MSSYNLNDNIEKNNFVHNKKNEYKINLGTMSKKIKDKLKLERKKKISNLFFENKLEILYTGDVYSYIHYGQPELNDILIKELNKVKKKNKRRTKLRIELKKKGLFLDETLKNSYNYINGIGYKKLSEIVRAIEIEHFFKYNTNFNKFLINNDESKAKNLALLDFIEKNGDNSITKKIKNNNLKILFN